jgi:hypothetical protein
VNYNEDDDQRVDPTEKQEPQPTDDEANRNVLGIPFNLNNPINDL